MVGFSRYNAGMKLPKSDTIAAISSAQGVGAIGIVRLSGPQALSIGDQMFSGRSPISELPGGRFVFGKLLDPDLTEIDRGLALVFRAPHSYTGEDVVEFQVHGSRAVLSQTLARCCALGARLAQAGEFTLRAYLAGKIDLAQAESVNLLIHSQTETAQRQALAGLQGALGKTIGHLCQRLTAVLAAIQAMLDYPEEGVLPEDRDIPLTEIAAALEHLLGTARAGQLAQKGARLALLGAPNAGKSSLLNALLGYERSIVAPIAGTTRDYLEADLQIAGLPLVLVDTAGLRHTEDGVEQAGVERSLQLAQTADLVLFLEDGSESRSEAWPLDVLETNRVLYLKTKVDLPQAWEDSRYLSVSASSGIGLLDLRHQIESLLLGDVSRGEVWLSSERQVAVVRRALEHVHLAQSLPDELASYEIEMALSVLAEITGRNVTDDILDALFSNFCVGK